MKPEAAAKEINDRVMHGCSLQTVTNLVERVYAQGLADGKAQGRREALEEAANVAATGWFGEIPAKAIRALQAKEGN